MPNARFKPICWRTNAIRGADCVIHRRGGIVEGLSLFGLWLWSLIHCCVNKQLSDTNRIIGIVLIVVLGIIGSLVYLFLPREPYRDEDEDEDEGVDRGPAPY